VKKLIKLFSLIMCLILLVATFAACNNKASGKLQIGVIQFASHPSLDNCYNGLIKGLESSGFKDGDNIEIDFQNSMGQSETANQLAKNMVSKQYDLIIGIATPAATAAYAAARDSDIPVIFCAVSDPVAAQLVQSLDAPGGNCTGTSDLLNLEAQIKMIRAFQPDAVKIGVLYTTSEANSLSHLSELEELAPKYQFEIVAQGVQDGADIPQAIASLVNKVDCINNFTDNNVVNNLVTVLAKANDAGIPVYGSEIEQVKLGCLASESLDYVALGEQTGAMAARVLKGEKTETMAVTHVRDSFPVVNTDVAEKFNLAIPEVYAAAEKVTTTAQ
jgi:putative ABC transport system substrate-binding protein